VTRRPIVHTHSHEHSHGHPHHDHPHDHDHDHDHPHDHDHDHDHPHHHDHEHHDHHDFPEPVSSSQPALSAGAGAGKVLLLDAPSGIAGDMSVAALLDLGVPFAVVEAAIAELGLSGYRLEHRAARSGAIGGSRFVVDVDAAQPQRDYATIDALIARAALEPGARELARRIFRRLAEAEAEVHRTPVETVTFHEVGAVDSIVDIVAAAVCFQYLGASVVASPLPLGRGTVRCQHGLLPLPAPATLLCLRGVPTYDAGIEAELVTPTGAAIVATVAQRFERWPSLSPERVGMGLGTKVLADRPNALRAVLGEPLATAPALSSHVVLEANVDDMTGELAGHAIEALLAAGALDCWAAAVTMKKGRPGLVISVLTQTARADELSRALLRETSSIGVRRIAADRVERPRRVVRVETPFGAVSIKVSEGDFGPPQIKPEFDECARLAQDAGVQVREVIGAALRAYEAATANR
jgi:uncharacterized protein (TIGR00299 family) protein